MDLKEYKKKKDIIIENIENVIKEISDERLKEILNNKLEKLKNDKFIISVFGHFSNGKSTFLNALMGFKESVLKEDESASTATITRLKYAEEDRLRNKAEIIFNDNTKRVIDANELDYYTARNESYDVEHKIKEVILYLDSELLNDGVEIVDTPGFNSTYSIHTEIAKAHVANSDASIFLFNYNKPGTAEEFSFLADVRERMDRIFLVLNKIDLEDKTESTVEDTIINLKNKIDMYGANVDSKIVYPISSKLEKEYLESKDEEKRERGRFKEFKDDLISYLTSEENIKDRLQAPLKSLLSEIILFREEKKKQLEVLNFDDDKLTTEIKKIEEEIEDLIENLNSRNKEIRKLVRSKVRDFVSRIESSKDSLNDDLNDQIRDYKTNFSMNKDNFNVMLEEFDINIRKKIRSSNEQLKRDITEIIDMNIDDEASYDSLIKNLKKSIEMEINVSTNSEVEFLSSENETIKKYEEELSKREEELEELEEEKNNLRDRVKEVEKANNDIEYAKKEIARLKKQKRERIESIGDAPIKKVEKIEQIKVRRKGIFGAIARAFVGDKIVNKPVSYEDRTEHDFKERLRKKTEIEYGEDISAMEVELANKEQLIFNNLSAREKSEDSNRKFSRKEKEYFDNLKDFERKKIENEINVFEINKRKFKNAIGEYIDEAFDSVKNGIDERILITIAQESLSNLASNIDKKKEYLEQIRMNEISGDRDKKINEISNEILVLNRAFEILNNAKEEI